MVYARAWKAVPEHVLACVSTFGLIRLVWRRTLHLKKSASPTSNADHILSVAESQGFLHVTTQSSSSFHTVCCRDGTVNVTPTCVKPMRVAAASLANVVAFTTTAKRGLCVYKNNALLYDVEMGLSRLALSADGSFIALTNCNDMRAVVTVSRTVERSVVCTLNPPACVRRYPEVWVSGLHMCEDEMYVCYTGDCIGVYTLPQGQFLRMLCIPTGWYIASLARVTPNQLLILTSRHLMLLRACDGAVLHIWADLSSWLKQTDWARTLTFVPASTQRVFIAFGMNLDEFEICARWPHRHAIAKTKR